MKKLFFVLFILIFSVCAYCQYGNIIVKEPKDLTFNSENNLENGIIHMTHPGWIGFFVEAKKDTKIKITVSAKAVVKYYTYPALRYVCDGQSTWLQIKYNEFNDYSVNFPVSKGIHFVKVENMPFLNTIYPKREIYIERIYVSGNQSELIENVTEKTILDACKTYIDEYRKEKFVLNKFEDLKINKTDFYWGICVNKNASVEDFVKVEKNFDFGVNEETEEFKNPIGDNFVSGNVSGEEPYAETFREQIENFIENRVETKNIRFSYNLSEKENVKNLFTILNSINLYGIPIQVYDLYSKENLSDLALVCVGTRDVSGIVFGEKAIDITRDDLAYLNPVCLGKNGSKYEYNALSGEYISSNGLKYRFGKKN